MGHEAQMDLRRLPFRVELERFHALVLVEDRVGRVYLGARKAR